MKGQTDAMKCSDDGWNDRNVEKHRSLHRKFISVQKGGNISCMANLEDGFDPKYQEWEKFEHGV